MTTEPKQAIYFDHGLEVDLDEGWRKLSSRQFGGPPGRSVNELIQNALDSYPSQNDWTDRMVRVETGPRETIVSDWGEGMSRERIKLLTTLGGTDKTGDESKIGTFGIGFFAIFNPALGTRLVEVVTRCEGHTVEIVFQVEDPEKRPRLSARLLETPTDFSTRIRVEFDNEEAPRACLESARRCLDTYPCSAEINGKPYASIWQQARSRGLPLFRDGDCDGIIDRHSLEWFYATVLCKYERVFVTELGALLTGSRRATGDLRDFAESGMPYLPTAHVTVNCNSLHLTISRDGFYLDGAYTRMCGVVADAVLRRLGAVLGESQSTPVGLVIANHYTLADRLREPLKNPEGIKDDEAGKAVRLLLEAPVYKLDGHRDPVSLLDIQHRRTPEWPLFYSASRSNLRWLGGAFKRDFVVVPPRCGTGGGAPGLSAHIFDRLFGDTVNLDTIRGDSRRIGNLVEHGIISREALRPRTRSLHPLELEEDQARFLHEVNGMLADTAVSEAVRRNLYLPVRRLKAVFFRVGDQTMAVSSGLFDAHGELFHELPQRRYSRTVRIGLNIDHPFIRHLVASAQHNRVYYALTYLSHELAKSQQAGTRYPGLSLRLAQSERGHAARADERAAHGDGRTPGDAAMIAGLSNSLRGFLVLAQGIARLDIWLQLLWIQISQRRLHRAAMKDYRNCKRIAIDEDSMVRRAARLRIAWRVFQRLRRLEEPCSASRFFRSWIRRLLVTAQRQNKESFFYLALNEEVSVIPFKQLNRFRSAENGFTIHRHQVALHPFPYMPDGLSISEALNPQHSSQKEHYHPGEERVVLLSDDVRVSALTPEGHWTQYVGGFGDVVVVSPGVFHQLSNPNDRCTGDFSVKDSVLQLRIETRPPHRCEEGVWVRRGRYESSGDATLFVHRRQGVATRLSFAGSDVRLDAEQEPVTEDLADIDILALSIPPQGASSVMPFRPIYPNFQVVRIFSWPNPIPPNWDPDADSLRLRGEITFLDEAGAVLRAAKFHGGDVIVMTDSIRGHRVAGFRITNQSGDLTLVAGTVVGIDEPLIVPLSDPQALDPARVGGKASGLAALSSHAPVPKGFVVATEAFRRFLTRQGLDDLVQCLDTVSLEWTQAQSTPKDALAASTPGGSERLEERIRGCSEELRMSILQASPPPDLLNQLTEAYSVLAGLGDSSSPAVSVRSSATTEDKAEASAAGQHDSFLNIRGVEVVAEHILSCWASLFSDRAVAYRNTRLAQALANAHSRGNAMPAAARPWLHSSAAMGVVIQQLVVPRVSGVAFSVDPTTGKYLIRLSGNYGLGESIVGGQVTPDAWWVDARDDRLSGWSLGQKTRRVVPLGSGGTAWRETDIHLRKRFCLSDEEVLEVARHVRGIANIFPYPKGIDTEFVIDEHGDLHFLQVRPITRPARSGAAAVMLPDGELPSARSVRGRVVSPGAAVGRLRVAGTPKDVQAGDIVVTFGTNPDWGVSLGKAKALLTDVGDDLCHAAILCRELSIPCIVATGNGTKRLREWEGRMVTLDAYTQRLYQGALPLGERREAPPSDLSDANALESVEDSIEGGVKEIRARGRSVTLNDVEWHGRPPHPLPRLQRALYTEAYRRIGIKLRCPLAVLERDNIVYVKLEDSFGPRRVLSHWSLGDWTNLLAERDRSVEKLLRLLEAPRAEGDWLDTFKESYINFNVYMVIARDIRTLTQIALNTWRSRFSSPQWTRLLSAATREHIVETHAALLDYEALLVEARSMSTLFRETAPEETWEALGREAPAFKTRLQKHACWYKFPGQKADVRTAPPLLELVSALCADLDEKRPTTGAEGVHLDRELDRLGAAGLSPTEANSLAEILSLATGAAVNMENDHHYKARAHFAVRDVLLAMRSDLVSKGQLAPDADVFEYRLEELISLSGSNTCFAEFPSIGGTPR